MSRTSVLEMYGIAKAFGKSCVLKGVDLMAQPGEIHILMDENGARKSILMKILTGTYTATSDKILIGGQPFHIHDPKDASSTGITLIYQGMQLAPNLTATENIFLGNELSHSGLIQRKETVMQLQKAISRLDAQSKASDRVTTLTVAEQQQVGVARALRRDNRVLVVDESIAALSSRKIHRLFELIIRLCDEGTVIIYISHRITEVYELSDRVSVLRDGRYVDSLIRDKLNASGLVYMMVGRPLNSLFNEEHDIPLGKARLSVHHLTDGHEVQPHSLLVRSREIVNLVGLVSTGRSGLVQLILGVRKTIDDVIEVDGKPVVIHSSHEAIDHGVDFLTEGYKEQGLLLELATTEDITMATLEHNTSWDMLNRKKTQVISNDTVGLLNIRMPYAQVRADGLPGGNRQKPLILRWVTIGPRILILGGSTRGVDVDVKGEIYRIMNDMARKGVAILMISDELPGVADMSGRVHVMREGGIAGKLNG